MPVWSPMRTLIGPSARDLGCFGRGGQRAGRGGEGDEEGVTLGIDLDPAMGGERVAHDATMLGQRLGIRLRAQVDGAASSSPPRR